MPYIVSAVTLIFRPGLHSILYSMSSFRLRGCRTVAAVSPREKAIHAKTLMSYCMVIHQPRPLSFFEEISNFSKFSSISAQFFHAEEIYDKSWRTQHDSRRGGVNGDSLLHLGDFLNYRDATPYGDAIMQGLRPQRRHPVLLT